MAIVQISKLLNRTGNLVDLPQLSEGELGWATDAKLLYVGKATPAENVQVLTSYSTIAFDQINGVVGNINITSANLAAGEVLAYNGNSWVNAGGNAGGLVTLGTAGNVKITGGATGYVLGTDGTGNLSWTPKGSLYTNITALSNATPIVMSVPNTTPYSNDLQVTITGVNGNANANVNGKTFYVRLAVDYPTSGNVSLYTAAGASGPVVGTGLTYTNSPNAIGTATLGSGGSNGGSFVAEAGGANTSIQYNNNGIIAGDSNLIYDFANRVLYLNGNANVSNFSSNGTITANHITSSGVSNLGAIGNVIITGGTSGYYLQTNGSGGLSWSAVAGGTGIANGTSNISIPAVNGNVNTSVGGTANVLVITTTGANIAGTANISGNLIAGNIIGTVANGNSNVSITANGNIRLTAISNTVITITGTGANIAGTANITGVANVGGNLNVSGNIVTATLTTPTITAYRETTIVNASVSGTYNIDMSLANEFALTLTGNTTFSFINPASSGLTSSFTLFLVQGGSGSYTATWPVSVKFPNGSTPTLATTVGKTDVLAFITYNGGTSYFGSLSLGNC